MIEECKHPNLEPRENPFKLEEAVEMTAAEVRKKWPIRKCPDCGRYNYDSFEHYVAGDW